MWAQLVAFSSTPGVAVSLTLATVAMQARRLVAGAQMKQPHPTVAGSSWDDDFDDDLPGLLPPKQSSPEADKPRGSSRLQNIASNLLAQSQQALSKLSTQSTQEAIWKSAWDRLDRAPPSLAPQRQQQRSKQLPVTAETSTQGASELQPAGSHQLALQGLSPPARLQLISLSLIALEERIGGLPDQASRCLHQLLIPTL